MDEIERLMREATMKPTEHAGYYVCAGGHVWSTTPWRGQKTPRKLATEVNRYGYLRAHLKIGDSMKRALVHRLVCIAFHGPKPSEAHQVRHLNGVRSDNRADNLRWGTAAENAADRKLHGTEMAAVNGRKSADKLRATLRARAALGDAS